MISVIPCYTALNTEKAKYRRQCLLHHDILGLSLFKGSNKLTDSLDRAIGILILTGRDGMRGFSHNPSESLRATHTTGQGSSKDMTKNSRGPEQDGNTRHSFQNPAKQCLLQGQRLPPFVANAFQTVVLLLRKVPSEVARNSDQNQETWGLEVTRKGPVT